jgi:predicted transposase/invertase (TIGR01784 family)
LRKSEQWIAYFSHQCSDEQREVLAMSEPAIKEAMNCEMHFTQDEKLRRKYEIQEKARRDYISMMYNIEKGREEGLEEGRKEGQEQERHRIVLSMLQKGFLYETISQITGIPAEEIAAIVQSQAWPIKE